MPASRIPCDRLPGSVRLGAQSGEFAQEGGPSTSRASKLEASGRSSPAILIACAHHAVSAWGSAIAFSRAPRRNDAAAPSEPNASARKERTRSSFLSETDFTAGSHPRRIISRTGKRFSILGGSFRQGSHPAGPEECRPGCRECAFKRRASCPGSGRADRSTPHRPGYARRNRAQRQRAVSLA